MDVRTPPENNPAGRLWAVLAAAQSVDQDAPALPAWASVLGVDPRSASDLLRAFSMLADLAADVHAQVETLPDEADPIAISSHIDEVDDVVERLAQLSDRTMRWSLAGLTAAGMLSLRMCASALGRHRPEPRIEGDQLRRLSTQLAALIEELHDADELDERTRRFILGLLLKVRSALDGYRLVGVRPLEAVTNEAVGALMRQSGLTEGVARTKFAARFVTFIVALDLSVNLAANLESIAEKPDPAPSPVVVQIVERCGQSLELPPSAWRPPPR